MDNIELLIQNGNNIYYPEVEEGITWETERKGAPGKLTFKVAKDSTLSIDEGNAVRFKLGKSNVFYGFLFTRKFDKDGLISIIAYDQLRYFKNKDTYVYTNKTAGGLLKMLAKDFRLNTGTIEDTGYNIASRIEENKTLFDMVQNSLDLTLQNKKKIFVLYDDFGKLTLKNVENMKLNILVDEETGENFSYESSIDGETYNKIKLTYDNKDTGKREVYIAQDSSNMNKWGTLQFYDKVDEKTNGKAKADALLSLYNKKTRKLSLSNVIGDIRVRAGSSIVVQMDLGDVKLQNYMLVEKAKHTFKNNEHFMDLTLRGNDFIA